MYEMGDLQQGIRPMTFLYSLLPPPVSLTRSGLSRIIPRFHRLWIIKRDDRADILVKLYLSFFSIYTIIEIGKRLSKNTFKTIKSQSPVADISSIRLYVRLRPHFLPLYRGISRISATFLFLKEWSGYRPGILCLPIGVVLYTTMLC